MTPLRSLRLALAGAATAALLLPAAAALAADSSPTATPPQGQGEQAATVGGGATTPQVDGLREVDADDTSLQWPESLAALPADLRHDIDDYDVIGPSGERIGEVEDVLANDRGEVMAVVVETGGLLGIGEEDVVVGLEHLELGPQERTFITTLTEDQLRALPRWKD
ncbi:PRC-barrel domain-containing protein [Caenispirillum bisanense]|uniref:PRC-barrel domain-containing protein n=1 Tax=Caenispirillum bisanense TaxID=414052 RepID=UPI0031E0C5E0